MSDILAIVDQFDGDEQLVEEIARSHPDKVTVLVQSPTLSATDTAAMRDGSVSDRIHSLCGAIERRTGAIIVGQTDNREKLRGWRFDRVITHSGVLSRI